MLFSFNYSKAQKNKFPLAITLAGYNYLQEPMVRQKGFQFFQWIYCADGQGEFTIRGQRCILSPGQMMLIYPQEPHTYRALTEEWHIHIIAFTGNYCTDLLKMLKMRESGIYHSKKPEIFLSYLEKIINIRDEMVNSSITKKKSDTNTKAKYMIELSKICYDFLLELSLSIEYVKNSASASGNETIQTIVSYMEEHYRESISLGDLADIVHLSECYVSTIFKNEMQQTIIQYLNNIRIAQARYLLIEYPELKASEIGKMCGFENPSYFGETFKKIVGMTPVEFRMS